MAGALIKLTTAGRESLVGPGHVGTVTRTITQIGVATAAFVHNDALVTLPNEIKRLNTFSGENVAADTIHVNMRDDTAAAYTMYGFGLYLDNGALFGTYSQDTPILEKSPASMMMLSTDARFVTIDAALLQFGDANWTNPPATESRQGVAEIATQDEADTGTDDTRIVSPKKLAARLLSFALKALSVQKDSDTGAAQLPAGTLAQRPANGAGKLRYNSETSRFEGNNGATWGSLGGATGGGTDAVFYLNDQVVNSDYTVPANQNAVSAGPINIANGKNVTVSNGSVWTIV